MMTFLCTKKDCINKDIEYHFLGNSVTAECGGCGVKLTGTNERPDPVIEPPIFSAPK